MIEVTKKRRGLSTRAKSLIALGIILLVTILALRYAPPEGEANNTTGDQPPGAEQVTVTNQIENIRINRTLPFRGVEMRIPQATLASKFSDDRKRAGVYTLRVIVQTINHSQSVVGIPYATMVRLILPNGEKISAKLISIKADQLAGESQTGFFDFPLAEQVPLASLKLQLDEQTIIPFQS
ncbi:MAG TPA: hypothetical protein VKX46_13290 [Ktedonobacteraceae bacterium]|nr:hypothetical protein [Ktedonobacteraceae bacterium]